MICNISVAIEKYNMISPGDSIAVGVSGGADSVCLLHFLSKIKGSYDIMLKAVHVNHNIRGEEAKRDEDFVRSFCAELGVPLTVFSVDVPALAKERKIGEEECGRQVRYECFEKLNCSKIAVAHTASDNCETVLFNLSRGSALKGVAGIQPVRGNVIRPLIECTREQIEEYCKENGLLYVTDSTNLQDEYNRNKIRHNVIPVLKEINPSLEAGISRFSSVARQEDEFLDSLAQNLLNEAECDKGYRTTVFEKADPVLQARAVAIMLKNCFDFDSRHLQLCLDAVREKTKVQLQSDLFFVVDEYIRLETAVQSIEPWSMKAVLGENKTPFGTFILSKVPAGEITKSQRNNAFDYDKININNLTFRSRQTGDMFSDPVRKVSKSVKKLFTENKIPEAQKNSVPILASNNELAWIRGFRADKKYALSGSSTSALLIEESDNEL